MLILRKETKMKERYEVLKQIRLCLRWPIDTFTEMLGFSSPSYVQNVEDGKVNNVEYIYQRYAKVAGIKPSTLRAFINEAEREHYSVETIVSVLKQMLRIS